MAWRDELRPGSFRDVPFHIDSADQQGGRRQVVHEFPQRDDPFVEDLGLRPHGFSVDCLVLGADYMAARDALIAALDAAGSGTLVHPYRGSLTVSCETWRCRESSDQGGIAWFSIDFVTSAVAPRPVAVEDTAASTEAVAAAALAEANAGLVAGFSVASLSDLVSESAVSRVAVIADRLESGLWRLNGARDAVSNVALKLRNLRRDVLTLVRQVPDLAGAVTDLVTSARLLADTPRAALRELRDMVGLDTGDRDPGDTPSRMIERANATALERLVTLAAAAEAVRATAGMAFESYDEAVAVRDDLAERLDLAAVAAADRGDDAGFGRLNALRLAMVRDVTRRGGSLARVYAYTPPATEPALVIAQRLYGDAGRADQIVARNGVRHPGFVTGGRALEVLTDG